ncbi:MAG: hypothetical protein ACLR2O_08690 [Coprococcus sp.]
MVHILGYGIDTKAETWLSDTVDKIQVSRIEILPQIQKNLEAERFAVDMEMVYKLAAPHSPVITNFANAILMDPRMQAIPNLMFTDREEQNRTSHIFVLSGII